MPTKFLVIPQQCGQVKYRGELSEPFPIGNDVKQGCVLAPTLFAVFFSVMLREAKENLSIDIYIRFRTDGSVFNLPCLLACTILELLFVDDCALLAHTEEALQIAVNHFDDAVQVFGLTISLKKTEGHVPETPLKNLQSIQDLHWQPPTKYRRPVYQCSTCLGSVISDDATVTKNVDHRLSKTNVQLPFGRLQKRVAKSLPENLHQDTGLQSSCHQHPAVWF